MTIKTRLQRMERRYAPTIAYTWGDAEAVAELRRLAGQGLLLSDGDRFHAADGLRADDTLPAIVAMLNRALGVRP